MASSGLRSSRSSLSGLGPGRPVAYFDVCVFSPGDLDVADEVVAGELART